MGNCCSKHMEEKFRVVDGRKYHNIDTANYPLPHDGGEVDRLTVQNSIFKHFIGSNYQAPVTDVLKAGGAMVLDAGCGPGAWTIDMAQEFPGSKFYGIDISPEFINTSAPNVTFIEGNVLDGLPYPDGTFDFVYSRLLTIAFTAEQWQKVYIPELLRVTKPGGWIEFFEMSVAAQCAGAPSFVRLHKGFLKFAIEKGMDPNLGDNLPTMLEATGDLTDITSTRCNMPFGPKYGEWGNALVKDGVELYQGAVPVLAETLNMTPEHVRALIDAFTTEVKTTDTFWIFNLVHARKNPREGVTREGTEKKTDHTIVHV